VTTGQVPETPPTRPWLGFVLVAIALLVVIVVVARLPGASAKKPAPHKSKSAATGSGASAVSVLLEVPSAASTTSSTTSGSTSTTSPPSEATEIADALRANGYHIINTVDEASPPASTKVEYITGKEPAAVRISQLLALPTSSVVPHVATTGVSLPPGTEIVIQIAKG
jgi:hypothetical protein